MWSSESEPSAHPDLEPQAGSFHRRFLTLAGQIEQQFPVSGWRAADVDLWPLARMDLYLDMFWSQAHSMPPAPRAWPLRAAARLATPLTNAWRSRHDRTHYLTRAARAYAVLFGDGVSLDRSDGAWHDRFGEPLIETLEGQGRHTFVMQQGVLARLPWRRATYSSNRAAALGAALARLRAVPVSLPGHAEVLEFLSREEVAAPSLSAPRLIASARRTEAIASRLQGTLRRVRPTLAFVVTYYAGLGAAFLVACRRERILSVDLQHCPQEGAHKAYDYQHLPAQGYSTLPAVFWNWTASDATRIEGWSGHLAPRWHRALHGGHTQLHTFLDAAHPAARRGRQMFEAASGGRRWSREIVVALQPLPNQIALWQAVRRQIEASPPDWRWWIRRHPAASPLQDAQCAPVLYLRRPNVQIEAASRLALPVLLREADVLISYASGAALEAAAFAVPSLFLSPQAAGPFQSLLEQGRARVVAPEALNAEVQSLRPAGGAPALQTVPLDETLARLHAMAEDYARW